MSELWGFIDKSGEFVIPPRFNSVGVFWDGRVLVSECGKYFWIDQNGAFVEKWDWQEFQRRYPPTLYEQEDERISEEAGKRVMAMPDVSSAGWSRTYYRERGKRGGKAKLLYGFHNHLDGSSIYPRFTDVGDFSEGLAAVAIGGRTDWTHRLRGGRWGFIDGTGKFAIQPEFDAARHFTDGLAPVNAGIRAREYGLQPVRVRHFGYVNVRGESVRFNFYQYENWGLIDRKGTMVVAPRFWSLFGFLEGLAPAAAERHRWGFLDKSGNWAIEPRFATVNGFNNGRAAVGVEPPPGEEETSEDVERRFRSAGEGPEAFFALLRAEHGEGQRMGPAAR